MASVMNEYSIPDGPPPRRDEKIAHASSHPELLNGDLAMTPHSYVSPASVNEAASFTGWRRSLGMFSISAVGLLLALITYNHATAPDRVVSEKQQVARACAQWHQAASAAVARLVHSTHDADLRQVNGSIFRMRRARRNCEAGWLELACQDYAAVATSAPGYVTAPRPFPCNRVVVSHDDRD
jgi:hypothetical protein